MNLCLAYHSMRTGITPWERGAIRANVSSDISMMRPLANGPRSLIVQVVLAPEFVLMILTTVPNGNDLCAHEEEVNA